MSLDWDDLRTFLAISRHGTLSAAARAIGVRQSTMGRRLAAIEEKAGAKLLLRTPAGFVPSPAGEAILGNVERIEGEALAIERIVTGRDVKLEGTVRLTTLETMAVDILMPILAKFEARYPAIRLELITDTRQLDLNRREADVALRTGRLTQHDLVSRKVAEMRSGLYASQAYLDRHGLPDFAASAPGHRLVLTLDDLLAMPDMAWFTSAAGAAEPALRTNSRFAHLAAAEAGMGIACMPRYLGDAGTLVRLATPSPAPVRELWLAVHSDTRHMPRIRALTDFLSAGLKPLAPRLNPPD
jgi:DNA-binding transcriptional LysR family regulator